MEWHCFALHLLMKIRRTAYFVNSYLLHDDGIFPNNSALPVIHYKNIFTIPFLFPSRAIKKHFACNGWGNAWKNSVFDFHHYHSTTHEVLGAYKGHAEIQLGGDQGPIIIFEVGDVIVIPAGVAHKRLDPKAMLKCVGAYPDGRRADLQLGAKSERPETDNSIQMVPLPRKDPVFGADGELMFQWRGYQKTA